MRKLALPSFRQLRLDCHDAAVGSDGRSRIRAKEGGRQGGAEGSF